MGAIISGVFLLLTAVRCLLGVLRNFRQLVMMLTGALIALFGYYVYMHGMDVVSAAQSVLSMVQLVWMWIANFV